MIFYKRTDGRCTMYKVKDGVVYRWAFFPEYVDTKPYGEWTTSKRTKDCLDLWVERGTARIVPPEELFLEKL